MIGSIKFAKVSKQDVPHNKRMVLGKYARFFDELLELPPSHTACVEVSEKRDAYNMTNELRKIAKKEGLMLGWSRNREHTAFYYWLERPKPAQVRRTA